MKRRLICPLVTLVFVLLAWSSDATCFAQTQYYELCKRQFDETQPGSREQLLAALKMTDALYHFDLEAAAKQADAAYELAVKLNDSQAQAVCEIDRALITGWLKGIEQASKHFDRADELFDESALPEYRVHFYSSSILYELCRKSGTADFNEYFRLVELASSECEDPHLKLQQHMLTAFNRVVLGNCPFDAKEVIDSRLQIIELNEQVKLFDAEAIITMLDAWQSEAELDIELYECKVYQVLELCRRSKNRLYQIFALGMIVTEHAKNNEWENAGEVFEEILALAELHKAPRLICDSVVRLAAINIQRGNVEEAKALIERALNFEYLNSRSQADRHALYKLAFELYCAEGDIENIKKFNNLMFAPEHMRAVVVAEQQTEKLLNQISKLKQNNRLAEKQHEKANSNIRESFLVEQAKLQKTIRALSIIAVVLAICALITALYLSLTRLSRVQKRLTEEQQSSRQGDQIRAGLELKLSRLQRMESLGLLAGGVAHDFNNVLVGVLGNAEILKLNSQDQDKFANDRIDQIIVSARKAASLSHQMLAYAGKQQIQRRPIDLNQLVTKLLPVLGSNLGPDMQIETTLWKLPLVCDIDETQIEQVLMNLVSNAVAASRDFGQILVTTGQEQIEHVDESLHGTRTSGGKFSYIEVEDFGGGVSESDMERIFEPFFSDKKSGRGLGLAVVYGMVNSHEGLIRAESQIDEGSRFRVLLPPSLSNDCEFSNASPLMRSNQVPRDSLQPTILIADDEAAVLDLTQEILKLNGMNVVGATNGRIAIELIEKHKENLDCLLLDVVMPEMGALDILREMDERQISIPVVLMSGFSHTQLREFKSESQVVAILEKPFRLDELLTAIEKAIGVSSSVARS